MCGVCMNTLTYIVWSMNAFYEATRKQESSLHCFFDSCLFLTPPFSWNQLECLFWFHYINTYIVDIVEYRIRIRPILSYYNFNHILRVFSHSLFTLIHFDNSQFILLLYFWCSALCCMLITTVAHHLCVSVRIDLHILCLDLKYKKEKQKYSVFLFLPIISLDMITPFYRQEIWIVGRWEF